MLKQIINEVELLSEVKGTTNLCYDIFMAHVSIEQSEEIGRNQRRRVFMGFRLRTYL